MTDGVEYIFIFLFISYISSFFTYGCLVVWSDLLKRLSLLSCIAFVSLPKIVDCVGLSILLTIPLYVDYQQINGDTMEAMTDLIFLGSKITVDADCSHEIKRCLLLGRKTRTKSDSVLKSIDTTIPAKIHLVKAMFFFFSTSHVRTWQLDHKEG